MFRNKIVQRILLSLIIIALVVFILSNIPSTLGLFGKIFKVLSPVIAGVAIAFILNIPLKKLEQLWDIIFKKKKDGKINSKIKRPICIFICVILMLCIIVGLLFMLIPQVTRTLNGLVHKLPGYMEQLKTWWETFVTWLEEYSIKLPHWDIDSAKIIETVTNFISSNDSDILSSSIAFAGSLFTLIFDLVLAFVLSIYILDHKEKLVHHTKRGLSAFFSVKTVNRVFDLMLLINRTFSNFISGQLIEAVILGLLCFVGMLIFRMPYAPLISTMIGVTALIPIFGAFIGAGVGAFFILLENPIQAIWFVVFIIVLQQLEGNLIYPKVVGKKVGLPGLWVLIAVTIGSSFGIVGMLVSVPICSVLYCLLDQLIHHYEEKRRANGENVEYVGKVCDACDVNSENGEKKKFSFASLFKKRKNKKAKKTKKAKKGQADASADGETTTGATVENVTENAEGEQENAVNEPETAENAAVGSSEPEN